MRGFRHPARGVDGGDPEAAPAGRRRTVPGRAAVRARPPRIQGRGAAGLLRQREDPRLRDRQPGRPPLRHDGAGLDRARAGRNRRCRRARPRGGGRDLPAPERRFLVRLQPAFTRRDGHAPSGGRHGPVAPARAGRRALRRRDPRRRADHGVPRAAAGPGPGLVNAGVYLVRRDALAGLPATCSLERDVLPALVAEGRVAGVAHEGYFLDIGVPESYARAQTEIPAQRRGQPPSSIATGSSTTITAMSGPSTGSTGSTGRARRCAR